MNAVAGVVGGRLVVAGGFADGVGHLTSVEAYTPTGWTPLPPLPHAASMATACVLNGRLYVMGGFDCNKLQVLEMSEENEFTWTVAQTCPRARYSAARPRWRVGLVCHRRESKIWLMGGELRTLKAARCSSSMMTPTRGVGLGGRAWLERRKVQVASGIVVELGPRPDRRC